MLRLQNTETTQAWKNFHWPTQFTEFTSLFLKCPHTQQEKNKKDNFPKLFKNLPNPYMEIICFSNTTSAIIVYQLILIKLMCKNNKYILRVRPSTVLNHLSNHLGWGPGHLKPEAQKCSYTSVGFMSLTHCEKTGKLQKHTGKQIPGFSLLHLLWTRPEAVGWEPLKFHWASIMESCATPLFYSSSYFLKK